ncbi:MAG: hypothetical protein ACRDUV_19090 [Pseudonocardiaceae bacterium]
MWPELDLLDETFQHKGVAQLEASRGCTNFCSFCLRGHKGQWAGAALDALPWILREMGAIFDRHPDLSRTVYLVDEEFIGRGPDAVGRALAVADTLAEAGFAWETSCLAIRTLTALGVPPRFTYITFDHLMTEHELHETYAFQGHTDLLLRPLPGMSVEEIVDGVRDEQFVAEHTTGRPFYTGISYMLVGMECLIGAAYTRKAEAAGLTGHADPSMGRVEARYADWRIGGELSLEHRDLLRREHGRWTATTTWQLINAADPCGT